MTVIVGVADGGSVWLGGDSLSHSGCQRMPLTPHEFKVFGRGDMVLGAAGPSRMSELLQHVLVIPEHPEGMEAYVYLVTRFAPALRAMLLEQGGLKINDASDGWDILLGYRGGLYSVCHDLAVIHYPAYAAIGCGYAVALGALYATQDEKYPERRIFTALAAAAEHDVHVSPPFVIMTAERPHILSMD